MGLIDVLAQRAPGLFAAGLRGQRVGRDMEERRRQTADHEAQARARNALEMGLLSQRTMSEIDERERAGARRPLEEGLLRSQTAATDALRDQRNRPPVARETAGEAEAGRIGARVAAGYPGVGTPPRPRTGPPRRDPNAPPDRARWIATEASKLAGQRGRLGPLYPDYSAAQAEATKRYDANFPASSAGPSQFDDVESTVGSDAPRSTGRPAPSETGRPRPIATVQLLKELDEKFKRDGIADPNARANAIADWLEKTGMDLPDE